MSVDVGKSGKTEKGLIMKCVGGLYLVRLDGGKYVNCRARGNFRFEKITPVSGDRVTLELVSEDTGYLLSVEKRKNLLVRPSAANIDMLVFVCACRRPDPDLFFIDKLTSLASANGIEPYILISKADIDNDAARSLCDLYSSAGYDADVISSYEKEKYADTVLKIKEKLRGKTSFLAGLSGAGKSSLINLLFPDMRATTGSLSSKIARGRNTTRTTELFEISHDTYIADTPGFSMLEIEAGKSIDKDSLIFAFPDLLKYAGNCRYTKCTHLREEGCGVIEALAKGEISPSRHESYVKLYEKMKKVGKWEYKD